MRLEATFRRRVSPSFALDVQLDLAFDGDAPVAALFGPSGSGKTTTLAVIAGLLRADSGRVVLDGRSLADGAVHLPPDSRGVGLVPQQGLLFPHLDVRGNLRYGLDRARGRSGAGFDRVVEVLELGALLARRPAALSGGERQRVALGRALLAAPRLLLLDEPVSALDSQARWRVLGFVERVVREFRVPTLYVSHARTEVMRIAPVTARMDAGRVVETGPSARVLPDDDAGPVWNLLRATADPGDGTTHHATAFGAHLALPAEVAAGSEVWCRVSSGVITLLPGGAATAGSARNRLPGRVISVSTLGARRRVLVDAGVPLQVDVTEDAVAELGVAPGVTLVCTFKAYALELL